MIRRSFVASLLAFLLASAGASAQAPNAKQIMERARIATTLQQIKLEGNLNKDGKETRIALFIVGDNIQFQFFQNNEWRPFHMRLKDDRYDLFEMVGGKTLIFPQEKLVQPIAGSDLTYEDLAFRFFYWPNPVLEGTESVKGQDCYKIRLNNPSKSGRYAVVYVWVHTQQGAFMRIRGHDKAGNLLKEFSVEKLMNIGPKEYTLRQMNVESYANGRVSGRTYVEFEEPKKPAIKPIQ